MTQFNGNMFQYQHAVIKSTLLSQIEETIQVLAFCKSETIVFGKENMVPPMKKYVVGDVWHTRGR